MLKTVIVEDEANARKSLINILDNFCPEVEIAGTADSKASGIQIIETLKPDIVFLDIEMPDGTGFELLQQLPDRNFSLIFATGHNDFAVKAFKFNAVDYILKPADPQDVKSAVEKVKERTKPEINNALINQLLLSITEKQNRKLVLKTSDEINIVTINEIIRCEAEGGYTTFYLSNGKKILVSKSLKEYEGILKKHRFIRAHNSHLVNLNFVEKFRKTDGGSLVMTDQSLIPVSVRKKEAVLNALEQLF